MERKKLNFREMQKIEGGCSGSFIQFVKKYYGDNVAKAVPLCLFDVF